MSFFKNFFKSEKNWTYKELVALGAVSLAMSKIDGKTDDEELHLMANIIDKVDGGKIVDLKKFQKDIIANYSNVDGMYATLKSMHTTKKQVVIDGLVAIALADGDEHPNEIKLLQTVARELGVDMFNESENIEAPTHKKPQGEALSTYMGFDGLERYLNERANIAKVFDALNFSLHNGEDTIEHLSNQFFINNNEQKKIIIKAFSQIGLLLETLKDLNSALRFKDPETKNEVLILLHPNIKSALTESISFLEGGNEEKNNTSFSSKVQEVFKEFEKKLNSEKFIDYPVPFWYDIVLSRSDMMKLEAASGKNILDIQLEWTFGHAEEYEKKYLHNPEFSDNDLASQAISLRIERFGFIYKLICDLEKKIKDLENNFQEKFPFNEKFDWDKASAAASLNGSIKFALKIGFTKEKIKSLYKDFKYNKTLIDGVNILDNLNMTQAEFDKKLEEAKNKTGIDIKNLKIKNFQIPKNTPSCLTELSLEKRHAIFQILCSLAGADGMTKDENIVLNDIRMELKIDISEYNNANIDGNTACDLLQGLEKEQKEELSKLIVLVVGADGVFSSEEGVHVTDIIKELKLDMSLLTQLISKYWGRLN